MSVFMQVCVRVYEHQHDHSAKIHSICVVLIPVVTDARCLVGTSIKGVGRRNCQAREMECLNACSRNRFLGGYTFRLVKDLRDFRPFRLCMGGHTLRSTKETPNFHP